MMISFTCGTGQQRVSAAELMKFFSLNFFQPKGMNKKTFEQKVKENVSEYFKLYDKDKDKYLNVNEFQDFAENSFEVTLILEIFLSFEKKFTTPSSGSFFYFLFPFLIFFITILILFMLYIYFYLFYYYLLFINICF